MPMPRRRPTAAQEIAHLDSHVKETLDGHTAGRKDVLASIRRHHPKFRRRSLETVGKARFTLDDARLVIALEHGFPTWDSIRREAAKGARARWNLPIHERTDDRAFGRAIRSVNTGNVRALRDILRDDPDLIRRRLRLESTGPFSNPGLLEIAAATHQRRDKVPPKLMTITKLLLVAGAARDRRAVQNALNLASAKPWPSESKQRELICLLIRHGADPRRALPRAVFQGALAAADELVKHGGPLDFVAMAATGRIPQMKKHLPRASSTARRKALALAAVNGQAEVVRVLLEGGLDPNRFNPRGFYEHSLPIHQAIWFGHLDTVTVLVEHGADLTIRDKAHDGTPLGWAEYARQRPIAKYLRTVEAARLKTRA